MKHIILLCVLLLPAFAQTKLATGPTITPILVSQLPAAASSNNGQSFWVSDSTSACTSGSGTPGSTYVLCYSNGSTWLQIASGGGLGATNCTAITGGAISFATGVNCNSQTITTGVNSFTLPTPSGVTGDYKLIITNSGDTSNPNISWSGASQSGLPVCVANGDVTTISFNWNGSSWIGNGSVDSSASALSGGSILAANSCGPPTAATPTQLQSAMSLFAANARTTTYSATSADFASCKTIPVASGSFTITLLASAPASGQCIRIVNYGSGTVTVSPNGLNINGSSSNQTLSTGSASAPTGLLVNSDGSNYEAQPLGVSSGGGGGLGATNCTAITGGAVSFATGVNCNSQTITTGVNTFTLPTPSGVTGDFKLIITNSGDTSNPNISWSGASQSGLPVCVANGDVTTISFNWNGSSWIGNGSVDSSASALSGGSILAANSCGPPTAATAANVGAPTYAAGGGTANAQTVTLSPAITSLIAGLKVRWSPSVSNTTAAPTLAVNGQTATAVTKCGTTALVANDIVLGVDAEATYDGTEFQLLNPQAVGCGTSGGGGGGTSYIDTHHPTATCNGSPNNLWTAGANTVCYGLSGDLSVGSIGIDTGANIYTSFRIPTRWTGVAPKAYFTLFNNNGTGWTGTINFTLGIACLPAGTAVNSLTTGSYSTSTTSGISMNVSAIGVSVESTLTFTSGNVSGCVAGQPASLTATYTAGTWNGSYVNVGEVTIQWPVN
jgi:hypothetical protein